MEYAMEMRMIEEPCEVVIVEDDVEVKVKEEPCEEEILLDTVYCVDGFETTESDIVKEGDTVTFRTNVKSKEDFENWKNLFFFLKKQGVL